MLLPVSRPTDKFASPLAGLRTLLLPDTVAGADAGGGLVTRTIPACACRKMIAVHESGKEPEDGVDDEEEEEDEGCWVSYGRGGPGRRRLPPPIPSLAARSALRRARTDDRRLVISRARVMRPDYYVRARRVRGGGGRLLMRLVEREDDEDPSPAPDPLAREDDGIAQADGATTSVAADEEVGEAQAAASPAPMPAAGCFEDVVRYQYAIGSRPLHQMPLPRMVH